jgi:DUF4097 and DUF4098 domain-containing protein YvlB
MGEVRTFSSTGTRHAILELGARDLEIGASDDDTIRGEIHGDDPDEERRVVVDTFGAKLRVSVPERQGRGSAGSGLVRLLVPADLDLTVVSGSGQVTAEVRLGHVSVKSGSGDLRLAATADVRAKTGSGDITVLSVAGEADLGSGSGDIRVSSCRSDLSVRTASGDVSIGRLDGRAEAKLASGDFQLGATTGPVVVRTASGDISIGVAEALPAWLDLKSNSGDVDLALEPSGEPDAGAPYVSIYARTGSGDIRIYRA